MNICVEIAELRLAEGVDIENFLKEVDDLEINFHSKQEGFMSTELLQGSDEKSFVMIQHWKTIELAKKASGKMAKSNETLEFKKLLDPKAVKLRFFESIGNWR